MKAAVVKGRRRSETVTDWKKVGVIILRQFSQRGHREGGRMETRLT